MDSVRHFKFFGGLRLVRLEGNEEREDKRFRSQKTATLLALLALRGSHTRDELCDVFWPEATPEAARNSLSAALSGLRREFGDEMIVADRHRVALATHLISTDVAEFETAIKQKNWKGAVHLYTGPLLPGFYDDPLPAIARELQEKARIAFREYMAQLEANSEFALILNQARRAITILGEDDLWFFALMRAHRMEGDPEAALQVFEEWQAWSRKNDEVVPEEAYQLAKVLRREKQHTKSLSENERISTRAHYPSSFPPQWTHFFGREDEKARLHDCLEAGEKLVTVTGTGGAGKTRLVVETLRGLAPHWKAPIYFVPLAALHDAGLLFDTVRDALSLAVAPDLPPLEQIVQALRGTSALLCLDNFEQLVEEGAYQLQVLREALPGVTFIITSRVLLNLPGEREFVLVPLPTPTHSLSVEEMRLSPSAALFCDRAQLTLNDGNVEAIGALCRRLEGIPLALELAAARAKILSPAQILERLDTHPDLLRGSELKLPPRQRTLRATIEWSINLLEPKQRLFFQRLTIFRGGWTLEAAEDVVAPGLCASEEVFDFLDQLRAHSLISMQEEAGGPRFRMLEMLREWGETQLSPDEKSQLQEHHFRYFLGYVESISDPLTLAKRSDELATENANFRLALNYALNRDHPVGANDAARLVGALCHFWEHRVQHSEGTEWAERALQKLGDIEAQWSARLHCCGGIMHFYRGDYKRAKTLLETGLTSYRKQGNAFGEAWALDYLGRALFVLGDGEIARSHGEAAVTIARATDDIPRLISSLMTTAWGCHISGSPLEAVDYFDQCLELCHLVGERRLAAICQSTKAFALLSAGKLKQCRLQCELVLELATPDLGFYPYAFALGTVAIPLLELGEVEKVQEILPMAVSGFYACSTRWEVACMLTLSANLAVTLGDWERAALLYGASESLCESAAYVMLSCITELLPPYKRQLEDALACESRAFLWRLGSQLPLETAVDIARLAPLPAKFKLNRNEALPQL